MSVKVDRLELHSRTSMDLTNNVKKSNQIQKSSYCVIPFTESCKTGKPAVSDGWIVFVFRVDVVVADVYFLTWLHLYGCPLQYNSKNCTFFFSLPFLTCTKL